MAQGQSVSIQEQQDQDRALLATNSVKIQSFSAGDLRELDSRVIPAEGLALARNCYYANRQLYMGRPGFTKVTASPAAGAIQSIAKAINGTTFVATDSAVYSLSGSTLTHLFDTEGTAKLLAFKESLFICDGGRLKRWDGSSLFTCGSHYEGLVSGVTNDDLWDLISVTPSTPKAGVKLTNSSYKRRIASFTPYLSSSSYADNYLYAIIESDSGIVAWSVNRIAPDALTNEYAPYTFLFDNIELEANTTYRILVYCPGITSGAVRFAVIQDYAIADGVPTMWIDPSSSWQDSSGWTLYAAVNGMYKPAPTNGIVTQGRLMLAEGDRIWFCGPQDPEDFWNAGGYFTFGDDENAVVKAMLFWNDRLWVSGTTRGISQTISYAISPITALTEDDFIAHGSVCWSGLAVVNETMLIVGDGWIGAWKVSSLGNKTLVDIGGLTIKRSLVAENTLTFFHYPDMWWLVSPGNGSLFVMAVDLLNTNSIAGPWTEFTIPFVPSAFANVDGMLFIGATDGHIYKLDWSANNDDGEPITARIVTKDFMLNDLAQEKVLKRFCLEASCEDDTWLTLSVYRDGETGVPVFTKALPLKDNIDMRARIRGRRFSFSLETTNYKKPVWIGPVQILFTPTGQGPSA